MVCEEAGAILEEIIRFLVNVYIIGIFSIHDKNGTTGSVLVL